jgi:AcrR family transcriptional regulator
MALDRPQIVATALELLREHGLGALSMRRLATELGVAPGALYWHVPSKQDLLAEVAELVLAPAADDSSDAGDDPVAAAERLRAALLAVRDGAEVVSFALSFRPEGLMPLRALSRLFGDLPPEQAGWAARTLTYFVLGAVAEEQNRRELVRAGILPSDTGSDPDAPNRDAAFRFGLDAILAGLRARPERTSTTHGACHDL